MNTSGCTRLYATDEAYRVNTPGACDVPLVAYVILYSSVFVAKIVTVTNHSLRWCDRRRKQQTAANQKSRIPIGPMVSGLFIAIFTLNVTLVGFDKLDFQRGTALSLYSIGYIPFAWNYSFALIRVVRLGEKILPKSHRGFDENKHLARFDMIGKILFILQAVAVFSSSLVLIVVGPIVPDHEQIFMQIGFACKAFFLAICAGGFVYQFERCITTIKSVKNAVKEIGGAVPDDLNAVIQKMRKNQLLHSVIIFPSILILVLLASGAIPAIVWIVNLPPTLEAFGTLFYELFLSTGRKRKQATDSKDEPPGNHHDLVLGHHTGGTNISSNSKPVTPAVNNNNEAETAGTS